MASAQSSQAASRSSSRLVVRATAVPTGGQLLIQVASGLVLALAARRFASDALALYLLAGAVVLTLTSLVDAGLTTVAIREVSAGRMDLHDATTTVLRLRLWTGGLAGLGCMVLLGALSPAGHWQGVLCGIPAAMALTLYGVVGAYRIGAGATLSPGRVTLADVGGRLLGLVLLAVVAVAVSRPDGVLIGLPYLVSAAGSGLLVIALYRRVGSPVRGVGLDAYARRRLLISAGPLALALVVNQIYWRIDTLVLAASRSAVELASYSLAYRLLEAGLFVGGAYQVARLPALAAAVEDAPEWHRLLRRSCLHLGVGGLVLVGVGWPLAPTALRLLGGQAYLGATGAFRVLLIAGALAWVNGMLGLAVISLDRQAKALGLNVTCLVVNVVGCIWLVPRHGMLAAAWVTVASEILTIAANLLMLSVWSPRAVGVTP